MWWKKKQIDKEQLIKDIIKDSFSKPGTTADFIATRLVKESGMEHEAALALSKQVLDEFIKINYNKITSIIKAEFPEIYTLPFSEINKKIIHKEIDKLAGNLIDIEQLMETVYDVEFMECENWMAKGNKAKSNGEFEIALNCIDTALKFSPDNTIALSERGKLLQDMNYHKDAIKDFSKIMEVEMFNFSILYLRGCSYLRLCEFDYAFSDITKAIEMSTTANVMQKQYSLEQGFDSIASMYRTSLELINTMRSSPEAVILRMKENNSKERLTQNDQ